MSLLFGALAMFIPVAGWMLIVGWVITGFWSRREEDFEKFPPFELTHFDKYLRRGMWPVLITFVPLVALVPFFLVLMLPLTVLAGVANEQSSGAGCAVAIATLLLMLLFGLLMCAMFVVLVPLKLRASLMQEFLPALDATFVKQFLALAWKETLLSTLFLMVVSLLLQFAGMLVFCVGVYAVPVITSFATMHLEKQLYVLYLARGGEPIPLSPTLLDEPPPLPVS
jgi:hypothetical protein